MQYVLAVFVSVMPLAVLVCDSLYVVVLTFIMGSHREGRQGSNTRCQAVVAAVERR